MNLPTTVALSDVHLLLPSFTTLKPHPFYTLLCNSSTPDTPYQQKLRGLNALYIAAGVIHLINAFQYIYAWFPLGYGLLHPVMIPEYLNVIGAALYLWSASLYNQNIKDYTYEGPSTLAVHRIETASSAIEVCAAFGWAGVWVWTYVGGPGRGWTLDDPDFYGNFFIIAPSIMYLVYNVENLRDPPSYASNFLYRQADALYFAGAVFYILAALRDDGWFQSFPLWSMTKATARLCGMGRSLEGCVDRCYKPCHRGEGGASGVPFMEEEEEEKESIPIAPTGAGKGVYSSAKGAWS